MGNPVSNKGEFRGQVLEYGLFEADSGSVGVNLKCSIEDIYHEEEWADYREYDLEVEGTIWIVKKDGGLNESGVQSLVKHAGWDGMIEAITGQTWQPNGISFSVEPNEYKGKTTYKINFIGSWDQPPGRKMGNVDETKGKALASRFGSQLRAVVGNTKRNAPPTANSKPAPPKKKPAKQDEPAMSAAANGDIPF